MNFIQRLPQRLVPWSLALAALAPFAGLASPATAQSTDVGDLGSYSYVRTLDGRATLASAGRGPGEEAEIQQPLLQGDTVRVERGARVEIALADRNLLRIAGDSSVTLARIAFSADRDDRTTRLDLDYGELLLVVSEQALGDQLPEIRTPGGTIYVHEPGSYRVDALGNGGCQLTVRDGFAELLTERGSTVVRAGEQAWAVADRWGSVEVSTADTYDALERWGEALDRAAVDGRGRTLHVEPYLAYQAASLDRYGDWVSVEASWYWRPRVAVGWRPYWQGRWAWTPSGMTWVSSEPWGWVPYHYGTWTLLAGYGWVWSPGRVYSPAWVYWYCSPSWTGWVPVGYYTHHYRPYWNGGFRFGVYGWTAGGWGVYTDWTFCPTRYVGHRGHHGDHHRGGDLGRTHGIEPPHGILTTDTRRVPRGAWDRPDEVLRSLREDPRARRDRGGDLPVVTDFVARRRDLPPTVVEAVRREGGERDRGRLRTPLDPGAPVRRADVGHGGGSAEIDRGAGWRERRVGPGERAEHGGSAALPGGGRAETTRPLPRERADSDPGSTWGRRVDPADAERGRDAGASRGGPVADDQGWRRDARERPAPAPPSVSGRDGGSGNGRGGGPASEDQGWRRDVRDRPAPAPPGVGSRNAVPGSDRGGDHGVQVGGERGDRSGGDRGAGAGDAGDRQGWKLRGGWSDRGDAARSSSDRNPATRPDGGTPPAVRRVITGVRRNDGPSADDGGRDQGWRRFSTPPESASPRGVVPPPSATSRPDSRGRSSEARPQGPAGPPAVTAPPGGSSSRRPSPSRVTPPPSRPSVTAPSRPSGGRSPQATRPSSPPPRATQGSSGSRGGSARTTSGRSASHGNGSSHGSTSSNGHSRGGNASPPPQRSNGGNGHG